MNETSEFLASHSGPFLFFTIFAEQIGLPIPAAPLLVAAGALVADGGLSAGMAIGTTMAACMLADLIWFYVGLRGGDGLLQFLRRLQLCDHSCFERTERLFANYGVSAVVAAKFVPGLSLLMPPLAGAFGMGVGKFLWFDTLGSLVYGAFYLTLGFLFRNQVNGVLSLLDQFGVGTIALASVLMLIFIAYAYLQRRRAPRLVSRAAAKALATVPGA